MKTTILSIFLSLVFSTVGGSQNKETFLTYTRHFTDLMASAGLEIRTDSLDHYILTDNTNPYLKDIDLYLVNPQDGRELIVIVDEGSTFPQLKFSNHIANLMNNENEHTVAFYSLDEYYILTELHADWAIDGQFIPKDREELIGYARSFYKAETNNQVTLILLAPELPLLRTPAELSSVRFIEP